jgi:methylaspartate mutase epsilon subunit
MLVGGLGDDAHSVGIGLLTLGFRELGFHVTSLGIRNRVEDFFEHAINFDIFLISNKNGHAELYLTNFPKLLAELKLTTEAPKLWYIGGHLSVSESDFTIKKRFLQLGFTNVYPKTISFANVVEDINQDIFKHNIKKSSSLFRGDVLANKVNLDSSDLDDSKLSQQSLDVERKKVRQEWHTGKDLLHQEQNWSTRYGKIRSLDAILWKNKLRGSSPLFQPRCGVADIEEQISLLKYLEASGSDVSSVQLDAASRSKMYDAAHAGLLLSVERKSSQLNGFPVPVYGVNEVRRLVCSLKNPFQLRAGGSDHKFTYEIALKAGIKAVEGGSICYCLPYEKLVHPVQAYRNWQYIDRLCALYHETMGEPINREYFGVLTATLIEPSLAISVNIIQALLSAQQGVKSITVGYAEQGNRIQDIAAMAVMEEMVNEYLQVNKFRGCRVTTVFHQFMAAFPASYSKAEDLIFNSIITATLAKATKVMVKTAVEAIKIPDRFDNAKAIQLSKKAATAAKAIKFDLDKVADEKKLIRQEVTSIMSAVLELGNGSFARGSVNAILQGVIDIPWSPNIYNKGRVVGVRDIDGAVRFYDFGGLPFNSTIKEFHVAKVEERKKMERDPSIFSLLEKDLSRIWKNDYRSWPLDGHYIN